MTKKGKKTLTTILIISIALIAYVTYIYVKSSNGEVVPSFSGILFALIPALLASLIWNSNVKKINEKK